MEDICSANSVLDLDLGANVQVCSVSKKFIKLYMSYLYTFVCVYATYIIYKIRKIGVFLPWL